MRIGLRGRMVAAGGLVASIVAGGFTVFLAEIGDLRAASRLASRSAEVTAAANRLEGLAIDLQTGTRGYVITRDERFLEPYAAARRELPARGKELLGLIIDPGQREQALALIDEIRMFENEFAKGVVAAVRVDPRLAQALVHDGAGRLRLDAIRARFERFRQSQEELAAARDRQANAEAQGVRTFGLAALTGSLALLALFVVHFTQAIVAPVRRLADASGRIAGGERSVRVPITTGDEIGALGGAFNAMATSLDRSLRQLAAEKDRVQFFYEFGELLAAQTYAESLSPAILEKLCRLVEAEIGALYAISPDGNHVLELASSFGIDADALPAELAAGEKLVLRTGPDWRHELQVPLVANGRKVGLIALARGKQEGFAKDELETIEHLAAQTAIRIAKRIAYESASRLANINRAVLDATQDGIRMIDLDGNTVLTNAAMDRLAGGILGLSGPVTAQRLLEEFPERTTDPDRYREALREIIANPDQVALEEFELVSGHWIERYSAPVRDAAGAIIGRIFIVGDVSRERKAERLKEEFVASVSHELRTPLTSIRGYLELLLDEESGALTDEQRQFLLVVDRNSERLLRLVADLLFVAQVDAGTLPLERGIVDLARLAEQCVEASRPLAIEKDIELRLDVDPVPIFEGDCARLAQMLDNLVSNAIKFTPRGGCVDVRAAGEARAALLEVSDNGIGIPAGEQERLFSRFFRTRAAGDLAIQGTGLGLSIAKAIAESHGGTISVDSEDGRGTTFRVELPLIREHGPADHSTAQLEAV